MNMDKIALPAHMNDLVWAEWDRRHQEGISYYTYEEIIETILTHHQAAGYDLQWERCNSTGGVIFFIPSNQLDFFLLTL